MPLPTDKEKISISISSFLVDLVDRHALRQLPQGSRSAIIEDAVRAHMLRTLDSYEFWEEFYTKRIRTSSYSVWKSRAINLKETIKMIVANKLGKIGKVESEYVSARGIPTYRVRLDSGERRYWYVKACTTVDGKQVVKKGTQKAAPAKAATPIPDMPPVLCIVTGEEYYLTRSRYHWAVRISYSPEAEAIVSKLCHQRGDLDICYPDGGGKGTCLIMQKKEAPFLEAKRIRSHLNVDLIWTATQVPLPDDPGNTRISPWAPVMQQAPVGASFGEGVRLG